jgi:predicted membrane protein
MDTRDSAISGRIVFAVALVALGALWTLDNLSVVDSHLITRWWPLLLVFYGATTLAGLGRRRNVFWGSFVGLAGVLLLLGNLGYAHAGLDVLWPLFLIAVGVQVLLRATGARSSTSRDGPDEDRVIQTFAALGGVTRRSQSRTLERADISAVMGGVELDLRDATPASGRVVADVFAVWGGIVILVPDTWRVESEVSVVMGALQDETKYSNPPEPAGTLVLRGAIMMAGLEVRNESAATNVRGVKIGVTRVGRGAVDVSVRRTGAGSGERSGDATSRAE